jgi:hypothetical protein
MYIWLHLCLFLKWNDKVNCIKTKLIRIECFKERDLLFKKLAQKITIPAFAIFEYTIMVHFLEEVL